MAIWKGPNLFSSSTNTTTTFLVLHVEYLNFFMSIMLSSSLFADEKRKMCKRGLFEKMSVSLVLLKPIFSKRILQLNKDILQALETRQKYIYKIYV